MGFNVVEKKEAAKLRVASENCKKITTFFQLQSKEQRPPKKDSHHASDWEMEDLDPNSALEMLWDDTPALTCKQVELLNIKRDRAMRIRMARRKTCEALEQYKRKWELMWYIFIYYLVLHHSFYQEALAKHVCSWFHPFHNTSIKMRAKKQNCGISQIFNTF